jgi:ribosome-associated toxin RatA of RatAB toxin-antitoxin module
MATRQVASVQIDAPREIVFTTLTDYNSYERWLPGVTRSRILAQDGDIAVAEFIWPIWMKGRFSLEFIHMPPESVTYVQTDQYRQRGLSGRWDLSAGPEGQGVVLTGEMSLTASWLQEWKVGRNLRAILERTLTAIRQQSLARGQGQDAAAAASTKTKILEVMRRPDSLLVWLFGEEYRLDKGRGKSGA